MAGKVVCPHPILLGLEIAAQATRCWSLIALTFPTGLALSPTASGSESRCKRHWGSKASDVSAAQIKNKNLASETVAK